MDLWHRRTTLRAVALELVQEIHLSCNSGWSVSGCHLHCQCSVCSEWLPRYTFECVCVCFDEDGDDGQKQLSSKRRNCAEAFPLRKRYLLFISSRHFFTFSCSSDEETEHRTWHGTMPPNNSNNGHSRGGGLSVFCRNCNCLIKCYWASTNWASVDAW